MTIFSNTSIPTNCSFCSVSYEKGELKDTDKVVELACHHFYHKGCIASLFREDKKNKKDLTCRICYQISIPKSEPANPDTFSLENLKVYFSNCRKDPYYRLQPEYLDALDELESRIDSAATLLGTMISLLLSSPTNKATAQISLRNWIHANIPPHLQHFSAKILTNAIAQDKVLRTLQEEISYLSLMDLKCRPLMVPKEGVPVSDYTKKGKLFDMRVSRDYILRATADYQYRQKHNIPDFDNIHNPGKFKKSLRSIMNKYAYDIEVSHGCRDVEKLRGELSNVILKNSSLPNERIIFLIDQVLQNSELSPLSTSTVSLIIQEILFNRGALRTLSQEVTRWRTIPIDQWPSDLRENGGINYIDEDNLLQFCDLKDFEKRVARTKKEFDPIYNLGKFEEKIEIINACCFYDREVIEAIKDLQKLRKEIIKVVENNAALPSSEILLFINQAIKESKVSSSSKTTIPFVIKEILFEYGALRTIDQEVDRWKKEPIEKWPLAIKERGIHFLDKDNSVKHCEIKDFEERVISQCRIDRIAYASAVLLFVGAHWLLVKNICGRF